MDAVAITFDQEVRWEVATLCREPLLPLCALPAAAAAVVWKSACLGRGQRVSLRHASVCAEPCRVRFHWVSAAPLCCLRVVDTSQWVPEPSPTLRKGLHDAVSAVAHALRQDANCRMPPLSQLASLCVLSAACAHTGLLTTCGTHTLWLGVVQGKVRVLDADKFKKTSALQTECAEFVDSELPVAGCLLAVAGCWLLVGCCLLLVAGAPHSNPAVGSPLSPTACRPQKSKRSATPFMVSSRFWVAKRKSSSVKSSR